MSIRETIEHTALGVSNKLLATGVATAAGSGGAARIAENSAANPEFAARIITMADIGVVVGILMGILGLCSQIYFHRRAEQREIEHNRATLHEAQEQTKALINSRSGTT